MVSDLNNFKNKSQTENTELTAQLEDAESKINSLTKAKNDLQSQLEDTKQELEIENKVCMKQIEDVLTCINNYNDVFHRPNWMLLAS